MEVVGDDGTVFGSDRFTVAICTCRRSRTYPWCDTSHRRRTRPGTDQTGATGTGNAARSGNAPATSAEDTTGTGEASGSGPGNTVGPTAENTSGSAAGNAAAARKTRKEPPS